MGGSSRRARALAAIALMACTATACVLPRVEIVDGPSPGPDGGDHVSVVDKPAEAPMEARSDAPVEAPSMEIMDAPSMENVDTRSTETVDAPAVETSDAPS